MSKRFSKKEKLEMILKNISNVVDYSLEEDFITVKCPICEQEKSRSISLVWKYFFYRKVDANSYRLHILTCGLRSCSCSFATNDEYVRKKVEETTLKNYGVKTVLLKKENIDKGRERILEKYGSFSNLAKKTKEVYFEKTGFSHNMRNPECVKGHVEKANKTKSEFPKEKNISIYEKRCETQKINGNVLFGGKKASFEKRSEAQRKRYLKMAESGCGKKFYSKKAVNALREVEIFIGKTILCGEGEKAVWCDNKKIYFLDGYLKDENIAIEFNGDYWHANPARYKSGSHIIAEGGPRLVDDIWAYDKKKKEDILDTLKCKYIDIWESDWDNNKGKVLEYIKEVVNG